MKPLKKLINEQFTIEPNTNESSLLTIKRIKGLFIDYL